MPLKQSAQQIRHVRFLRIDDLRKSAAAIKEIFRHGLLIDASAIILSHNHPSGDPAPSPDDIKMTDTIITACQTLDITVHDHVIIGLGSEPGFLSMRSAGLIK